MKKTVLAITLGLLAFVGGVAGMYFVMPYVAPDRVEAAQQRLDSLTQLQTAMLVDSAAVAAADSTDILASDSTTVSPMDSMISLAAARELHVPRVDSLADSLATLQARLQEKTVEADGLRARVDELLADAEAATVRREQTVGMANTLARLDDRELEAILRELDIDVLESLYFEASGRNRQRLLQSMPSDRAATFVDRLVNDNITEEMPATAPTPAGTN